MNAFDTGPARLEPAGYRTVVGVLDCLVAADDLAGLLQDGLVATGTVVHCELVVFGGPARPESAHALTLPGRAPALTDRQTQILGLVAAGLTDLAVAHRLRITARTVGKHLEHIYRRLGVDNRTSAAAWWLEAMGTRTAN